MKRHWHLADYPGERSSYGSGFKTKKAATAQIASIQQQRRNFGLTRGVLYIDSCSQDDCRMVGEAGR